MTPHRVSRMALKVLNLSGVLGFSDEGMSRLMPQSGPTVERLVLDGATSMGESRGGSRTASWRIVLAAFGVRPDLEGTAEP